MTALQAPPELQGPAGIRPGLGSYLGEVGPPSDFLLRLCLDILPAVAAPPWVQVIRGRLGVAAPPRLSVLNVPPAAHSQDRVSKRKEKAHVPITRVTVSLCPEAQGLRWVWVEVTHEAPILLLSLLPRDWVLPQPLSPHSGHGSWLLIATFSDYVRGQKATLTWAETLTMLSARDSLAAATSMLSLSS